MESFDKDNIFSRKNIKIPEEFDEFIKALKEMLGSFIIGLNIIEIFTKWFNAEEVNDIKNTVAVIYNENTLKDRLEIIKNKINSNKDTEIYGAILYLFSELEKFIDIMFKKYCPNIWLTDEDNKFRNKVKELEKKNIISFEESYLLNHIYQKRNFLSHGKFEKVNKDDIEQCFKIIYNFMIKYYNNYKE